MSDNPVEIRGFAFIDSKVVMVGKATQEKVHGEPHWLCQTYPPHAQYIEMVTYQREVIDWLKEHAGAEEIFSGASIK